MKKLFSNLVRFLCLLSLAVWTAGPLATAQTPAGLGIQTYAGLTITGAVGTVYSVEYLTDLAQANPPSAWRCLEFLQLPASPYLWADKSAPATDKRFFRAVPFAAPTNLVFIPPGTFWMGSPTNQMGHTEDEGPQTAVTISRGFWMGKYLVTQGDYLAVMRSNPSHFTTNNGYSYLQDLSLPVEQISWFDATNYCGQLTHQARTVGWIPTDCVYRLPTEAEWEYACRAWTSTRFSYGDDSGDTNLDQYAWTYYDNVSDRAMTHPVGQKLPNPWGLYDMYGNVWEWCQDFYGSYPGGIVLDPKGAGAGSLFVIRGGASFNIGWRSFGSPRRFYSDPTGSPTGPGFRVVLSAGH